VYYPDLINYQGGHDKVKAKLAEVLPLCWEKIPPKQFEALWRSIPSRVQAVIDAKGHPLLVTVSLGAFFYLLIFSSLLLFNVLYISKYLIYGALEAKEVGESPANAAEPRHDLTNHEDFCA
jgi:hypothetical protein